MRLKSLIYSIMLFGMVSCTDTNVPLATEFSVGIKNVSNKSLLIKGFYKKTLVLNKSLSSEEKTESCKYVAWHFRGYHLVWCKIDSMVFKFSNNRGYISSANFGSIYNFANSEHPFGYSEHPFDRSNKFLLNDDGVYEFIITQEDYENAHELPE